MDSMDCVVCGDDGYDSQVIDRYTLVHLYVLKGADGSAAAVPPGTGQELNFCSAKCLTQYVNTKIAPDAAGE
jgi:hypothetical protein